MVVVGTIKMFVDDDLCEKFELDPKQVASIARRISKAMLEAEELGLHLFGGSGNGTLRFSDASLKGPNQNEVADLDGFYDGGDGSDVYD